MARVIGIDLGTTNTVIAVMDGARPRVLPTRDGQRELRSTVSVRLQKDPLTGAETREELIGQSAEDNTRYAPSDTIVSIKRLMGRAVDDPEIARVREQFAYPITEPGDGTRDSIRVVMGGQPLSPVEISAKLLRRAAQDAERACGEPVRYAVITVPAYFSESQRAATKNAATAAGLHVVRLLDEPTAAAVAFGIDAEEREVKTILVYDLGGGTFDISVLMMAGKVFAPLALQGDMWLGGDDFDRALVDMALERIERVHGVDARSDRRFMAELGRVARDTKERLSRSDSADLIVAGLLRDARGEIVDVCVRVTRAQFEAMIRPLIDRTLELTRRAIEEASLTPDHVDCVLLAGNSSQLPLVRRAIEDLFGPEKILRSVAPKHSVALGAALVGARTGERIICQALASGRVQRECGELNPPDATHCQRPGCGAPLPVASEEDLVFTPSVAPFHYGAQSADDRFALFVRKGDPYPTEEPTTQIFGTIRPNQRIITVPVFGGEDLERASANEKQGEAVALLPPGLPQGSSIAIALALDAEGLFTLCARLADGRDLHAFKTQGEADAKAIAILLAVEQALTASPQLGAEATRLEPAIAHVFEHLRSGNAPAALERAEQLRRRITRKLSAGGGDARARRELLIGYCEHIAQRYRWVDEVEMDSFGGSAQRARRVLAGGDADALEAEVVALEKAWRDLPELVRRFVDANESIALHVRPVDWTAATRLERDLEGLEQAFKGKNRRAPQWWDGFVQRLAREVERCAAQRGAALRCVRGHEVAPGHRHCPVPGCGVDLTALVHKRAAGESAA